MPHSSFDTLLETAETIAQRVAAGPVATRIAPASLRRRLAQRLPLDGSLDAATVLAEIEDLLRRFAVQVTHPRYFGLFNPSVLPETVAATGLVTAYNSQAAVWSHSPAAIEIEQHAIAFLAERVGWPRDGFRGHFTSGGQEANLTAVIVALASACPAWRDQGARALPGAPVIYASRETHHSLVRAARVSGLGNDAVRVVGDGPRLVPSEVREAILEDRAAGRFPVLVAATAGSTSAGAIDPLGALADVCDELGVWLHVDAAWGGGALLSPTLRGHLAGIERAHSVTWDAHKWLSCPMGSGTFLCRDRDAVAYAFEVVSGYMPAPRPGADDPHGVSLQCSRRAVGVPVAAALATRGPEGLATLIEHQAAMGDALRSALIEAGFRVVNDTPLPLVCFTHARIDAGDPDAAEVARRVERSGRAWISPVTLDDGPRVLRACITSYRTTEADVAVLVSAVTEAIG